ncbi:hypothetical protein A3E49_03650 [Candidatus Saccharibacteria bacterium RIFCSPHIGHO2_12_FULL_49_19]|nr:MAG: hypothetical protein A2708_02560 [Candidatus Saccharibacteria bacterium RIFCSPHIGHO2_01_FULL_49_21]OGL36236.1 MAG: hypothetical protein A3E49_03650 [Candidatus Saccharibacteria bacterium RIFCSPHIGHO2_12_FULL_49_19]OGL37336.1 MAG: hypothetical protein A3B63_02175 [Candidatus Saccharibacteria bacterium RIFCSPLOWO2_01_FULL_49_22]
MNSSDFRFPNRLNKKTTNRKPPATEQELATAFGAPIIKKLKKPGILQKFTNWWNGLNRNLRFGIIALVLLVFGAISIGIFFLNQPHSDPSIEFTRSTPPKPTTVASPLTGIQVDPEQAKRPVTGIMIENSQDARPQSALHEAGVVFEAIAEGGITRFIALFQEARPAYVGPVRSLRPYYIDFASAFAASVAHIGGSPDALNQIRSGGRDLDQFFNSGSYWRVSSRRSPHNVYTSFDRLDELNQKKGYTNSQFTPWPRKDEAKLATPTARVIDVKISSAPYNSHYDYDPATNSYSRSQGGQPHISTGAENGSPNQQLTPKVVIVLITTYSISGKYSVYGVTGGGLLAFQDGGVISGSWSKAGRDSQFVFTDSAGAPLKLNAGQAWVTLAQDAGRVSYAP